MLRRQHGDACVSPLTQVTPDDVRTLLDAIPTGLLLIDAEGFIVEANAAATQLLGHPNGGLRGVCIREVLPAHDHGGEQASVQADGTTRPICVDSHTVRIGGRDVSLLVLMDATDLRRQEQDTARHHDEIAHLSRVAMLGELSGALAHELNQPLATILTNAQTAQRLLRVPGEGAPKQLLEEILGDIVAEDRRAKEVIQRLRKWLRKEHAELVPLVMNDVVLDSLRMVRTDLLRRGADVQLELGGNLPVVKGDRILLQQVLLNFVINACDAMDGLTLPHLLCVRSCESANGGVRVEVLDRGRGIAPSILPVMFEPFQTTKPGGMGMGLSVSRNIIEAHGGRVLARVRPEGGACVAFELPGRPP